MHSGKQLGAAALGVALGICFWGLVKPSYPTFAFLDGVRPLASTSASRSTERGYLYSVPMSVDEIKRRAKSELGFVIEREHPEMGRGARVLTVPRIEAGRVRVASLPEKQILLVPGRSWIDAGGSMRIESSGEGWTTVEVRQFRGSSWLQGLRDWIHRKLAV